MRPLARELNISEFAVRKKMVQEDIHPLQVVCLEERAVHGPGYKGEEVDCWPSWRTLKPIASLSFTRTVIYFSRDQKVNRKKNSRLCGDISKVLVVMATNFSS
jgi:hypothetical protein